MRIETITPARPALGLVALLGAVLLLMFVTLAAPSPVSAREPDDCRGSRTAPDCEDPLRGGQPVEAERPDIVRLKTDAANAYDAVLRGAGSKTDLARIEDRLYAATGEARRNASSRMASLLLNERYRPFRQVNTYYCGPATVASMLWFMGAREMPVTNANGERPALTGDTASDQALLAGADWLNTESMGGTGWGGIIPRVLNEWRGTEWYVESATERLGGTLTKDQAFRNIRYSLDRGYPVAANILYGASTFYPAGFAEGRDYEHWNTLLGYFERDGQWFVRVGEVYGDNLLGYQPLQEIPWDQYWTAIEAQYGIVW